MFKLIKIVCGLLVLLVLADTVTAQTASLVQRFNSAALERLKSTVTYDPAYVSIKYPMGDVPAHTGVCSDVIIRSYRAIGLDLQELVHKDMQRAFDKYPKRWGLKRTDKNIDHRRVANLRVFFTRHGKVLKIRKKAADYKPGDLVSWDLSGTKTSSLIHTKLPHIGIVTNKRSVDGARPLIVHNIGQGPKLDDMLFDYKITGHYRYLPSLRQAQ
ncbi:MAG: DUF1287 domain-containing protein [bacterium]|nr:DUF1287 domain-containing protein [bacterium]